jgi:DNA-binding winged helix-turn-helix (wHTH) protein
MYRTGGVPAPRSALVAVADCRALSLAHSFGDAGFVPTLAFTAQQLDEYAGAFDVIVADEDVDAHATVLRRSGDAHQTIRMFIAEPYGQAPPEVHAVLPRDLAPRDLVSRACALLTLRGDRTDAGVLTWGPLSLDPARRDARWHGTPLVLTSIQFKIIAALVRVRGAVLSKRELEREVWPDAPPDGGDRLVAHIRRIRGKIEVDPSHPQFLLTARGEGFRLADPASEVFRDWDGTERRRVDRRRRPLAAYRTETA